MLLVLCGMNCGMNCGVNCEGNCGVNCGVNCDNCGRNSDVEYSTLCFNCLIFLIILIKWWFIYFR